MLRILVNELQNKIDKKIKVCGWVQQVRDQKRMQFLILRDHTGIVQIINDKKTNPQIGKLISNLTAESTIEVIGQLVHNASVKMGQMEILAEKINISSISDKKLPIDGNSKLESRLDWRHLDLRRPENILMFQIETTLQNAMRHWWFKNNFIEIHTPKIMGAASESGAELFSLNYFQSKAYLAQSPQFYKQMAMSSGFDRIFEIGPVFRADPSYTSRHCSEFVCIDSEVSWINSHEDVMSIQEKILRYALWIIKKEYGEEIEKTFGVSVFVPETPFPRISIAEAYDILYQQGYFPREGKGDLDPEAERRLSAYIKNKYGHEFVFVTDYPVSVRPFYHMRHDNDPTLTKSYDLLWKGLEITTGAQREHRYEFLLKQILEKGLSLEPLEFYLNFFKNGCPPHGGFGMGLSRLMMLLLEKQNVREVSYLFRGPKRLFP